jgi:hypothetical protein
MKSQLRAALAALAVVAGAVWSVHVSKSDESCPRPSAASVEMLFAPCQVFDAATVSPIPPSDVGLPNLPTPNAAPLVQRENTRQWAYAEPGEGSFAGLHQKAPPR